MSGIDFLRKNGEILQLLDFGEAYYNPDRSIAKSFCILNNEDHAIVITPVINDSIDTFSFKIIFFPVGDECIIDDSFREMIAESQQDEIVIEPTTSVLILAVLTCIQDSDLKSSKFQAHHNRSSFSNILGAVSFKYSPLKCSLSMTSVQEQINSQSNYIRGKSLPISMTMCTSIMYIDEVKIDFESCIQGNTYVRDVQVWNRSECRLLFRFVPTDDSHQLHTSLVFSEFDSGRTIQFYKPQQLAPFSSRRIRCSFRAKAVLADTRVVFAVENLNNPSNTIYLECRTEVKDKEGPDPIQLEGESKEVLKSGDIVDLGDCYTGIMVYRRLWLRNVSNESIFLKLLSDHPNEISFDLSGHLNDLKASHNTEDSAAITLPTSFVPPVLAGEVHPLRSHGHSQSPLVGNTHALTKQQRIPDSMSRYHLSSSQTSVIANNQAVQMDPYESSHDQHQHFSTRNLDEDEDDELITLTTSRTDDSLGGMTAGLHGSSGAAIEQGPGQGLGPGPDAWGPRSIGCCLDVAHRLIVEDSDEGDESPLIGRNLMIRNRAFPNPGGTKKRTSREIPTMKLAPSLSRGVTGEEASTDIINRTSRSPTLMLTQSQSQSAPSLALTRVSSGSAEELILKPGERIPITLIFCPVMEDRREFGTSSWSPKMQPELSQDMMGQVVGGRSPKALPGALFGRTFRLYLQWRSSVEQSETSGPDDFLPSMNGTIKSKADLRSGSYSTKKFAMRARCCTSVISVSPAMVDLGECNVGEYRAALFTVRNESDLPALVLPHVESETLGVIEKEVNISPRGSKQIQFEYVARLVNTDYKRDVVLINALNSHGNLSVEVRAKNIDVQQVLLHSLFYRLYTNNTKRQLQIFYDKCVYNMPNLRTFAIRNIYSEPLVLELTPPPTTDPSGQEIQIFQILNDESSNSTSMTAAGRNLTQNKNQAIEDLKWGNSRREASQQSVKSQLLHANSTSDMIEPVRKYSLGDHSDFVTSFPGLAVVNPFDETDRVKERGGLQEQNMELNFVTVMSSVSFPFGVVDNLDAQAAKLLFQRLIQNDCGNFNSTSVEEDSIGFTGVRIAQHCYKELTDTMMNNKPCKIVPLALSSPAGTVTVPTGRTSSFVVMFCPKSADTPEELGQLTLTREIQLRLLSVDSNNVSLSRQNQVPQSNKGNTAIGNNPRESEGCVSLLDEKEGEPLKPRSLLLRAKATRSEMSVTQRNINFGRTTVGETATMGVTIVNKSSIPLLFSINKSGSISSGFLRIAGGRKGRIEGLSSQTVEFGFRPTLPGPFEETLTIENVLDPRNKQSVVIKARVSKLDYFVLLPTQSQPQSNVSAVHPSTDYDDNENDGVESAQGGTTHADVDDMREGALALLSTLQGSVDYGVPNQYLGELVVREPSSQLLSFHVRNTSLKARNFIIDATHSDSTSLMVLKSASSKSTDMDMEADPPFEPIPEILQSICTVRCQFSMCSTEALEVAGRMSMEERKALEDKLEHFQQKLKIAIRKKKPDKISKYEQKIKEAKEKLTGVVAGAKTEGPPATASTPPALPSETKDLKRLLSDDMIVEADKKVEPSASSTSVRMAAQGDSSVFHFHLGPENDCVIQVTVTFFPGESYEHWDGPLPFQGSLRVFEARNEDTVKIVRYCAMVYSSKKPLEVISSPISLPQDRDGEEQSVEGSRSYVFPTLSADILNMRNSNARLTENVSRNGSEVSEQRSSVCRIACRATPDSLEEDLDTDPNDLDLDCSGDLTAFFATVAPWSAVHTKNIIPWYKELPECILGMSLKLVQVARGYAMQASFSVEYLASEKGQVQVLFTEDIQTDNPMKFTRFNQSEHGPITFALGSKTEGFDGVSFSPIAACSIEPDGVVECITQWIPKESLTEQIHLGYVAIRVKKLSVSFEAADTQYIPLVCVVNRHSIIKIDKHVNFDEVPLGSNRDELLTVTNLSDVYELVYNARVLPIYRNHRGTVVMTSGTTGVIEPLGKKTIGLNFSGTSLGKFEQELIIQNVKDGFDQKRIAITAQVTWPQSQFIQLPDFELNEKGKVGRWDMGLIQVPVNDFENTVKLSVYKLNVVNVSGKVLYVTGLSNLKKQCFLYTDEACTQSVVSHPMPERGLTTLYVAIRPSNVMLAQQSDTSISQKEKRDREEELGRGRELAGGIRLVFFAPQHDRSIRTEPTPAITRKPSDVPGDMQLITAADNASEAVQGTILADSPDQLTPSSNRKLFETSITFKAQVGSSLLRGKLVSPRMRLCWLGPGVNNGNVGILKGVFCLYNASSVFPLRYGFLGQTVLGKHFDMSRVVNFPRSSNDLTQVFILDDSEGDLKPLENRLVEFLLAVYPSNGGLVSHTIKAVNLCTNDTISLNLSVFLDVMTLTSSLLKPRLSLKPELFDGSAASLGSGLRFMRGVFVTEMETVNCETPIWLGSNPMKGDRNSSAENDAYVVIGSTNQRLCAWQVTNGTRGPITITPVSDMPVTVMVEGGASLSTATPQRRPLHVMLPKNVTGVSERRLDDRRRATVYTSMLGLPEGTWRHGLNRCGNTTTISAGASVTIVIEPLVGGTIADAKLTTSAQGNVDGGKVEVVRGVVAFVTAAQALQSFFDPFEASSKPFSPASGASSDLLTGSSSALPVVSYTRIAFKFVRPKISLPKPILSLGVVRRNRPCVVTFQVQNHCDVDLPFRLENIAQWMDVLFDAVKVSDVAVKQAIVSKPSGTSKPAVSKWWKDESFLRKEFKRYSTACDAQDIPDNFRDEGTAEDCDLAVSPIDTSTEGLKHEDGGQMTSPVESAVTIRRCTPPIEAPARCVVSVSVRLSLLDAPSSTDLVSIEHSLKVRLMPSLPVYDEASANASPTGIHFPLRQPGQEFRVSLTVDSSDALEITSGSEKLQLSRTVKHSQTKAFVSMFRGDLIVPSSSHGNNQQSSVSTASGTGTISSPYKLSKQITVRNMLQECLRVQVDTSTQPDAVQFVDLEVFQRSCLMSTPSFDLVPGESVDMIIIASSKVGGRVPEKIPSEMMYMVEEGKKDDQQVAQVAQEDRVIGPLLLGSVRFVARPVTLSVSGSWPSAEAFLAASAAEDKNCSQDCVLIDVVGMVRPGPLIDCSTSEVVFCVDHMDLTDVDSRQAASASASPSKLRLRDATATFQLLNSSLLPINYSFRGFSLRIAGMRLQLASSQSCAGSVTGYPLVEDAVSAATIHEEDDTYDTVTPLVNPKDGVLGPSESLDIMVRLGPGIGGSKQAAETTMLRDGFQYISGMKLKVWDREYKHHPPRVVSVVLQLDKPLSPLLTESVNVPNSTQYEDDEFIANATERKDGNSKESDITAAKDHSSELSIKLPGDPPRLRLRGVTPCHPVTGQFEICLGQQSQRKESLEWQITLENSSDSCSLKFRIKSISSLDGSWINFGQRRGDIDPAGQALVNLYFSRSKVGIFFTYIVIQNMSNCGDVVILRVSMEVAQDYKLGHPVVDDQTSMKPLFEVRTALGPRVLSSLISREEHVVDFTDVLMGRLYRRRSFVIVNTSDISLEFQLSSTLSTSDLMFTLSPISLKPCSQLTVDRGEKRQVFVVFCPTIRSIIGMSSGGISTTSSSSSSASGAAWPIEGEIFVACRLMKDHQETIKLYSRCRRPTLHVELSQELPEELSKILVLKDDFVGTGQVATEKTSVMQLFASDRLEDIRLDGSLRDGWRMARFVCIKCVIPSAEEALPLSIYSYMQSFHVSIIAHCDSNNVYKAFSSEQLMEFTTRLATLDANEDVINFSLHGGETLWLHVQPASASQRQQLTVSSSFRRRMSISEELFKEASGGRQSSSEEADHTQIFAEEHFTIYNRQRPSEKYRVPVRLVSTDSTTGDGGGNLDTLRRREGMGGVGLGSTSLFSFSGLEGAIAAFLKEFTTFWPTLLLINNTTSKSPEYFESEHFNSPTPLVRGRSAVGDLSSAVQLIGQGASATLASQVATCMKILESYLNLGEDVIVFNLRRGVKPADPSLLQKPDTEFGGDEVFNLARIYVDLLFRFFALTDELALHTLRQSSLGNAIMSSVHKDQPAARLAQLMYTVSLGHPVFESFSASRGLALAMPITLIPFAKQLLYYMGFFPEVDGSMEPLLDICGWVKTAISTNDRQR